MSASSPRPVAAAAIGIVAILGCAPPPVAPPAPPPRPPPAAAATDRVYEASGAPDLVFQIGGALDLARLSTDGLLLATAARDERAVRLWDMDRRAVVIELGMLPGVVRELRWEGGGKWLLTIGSGGSVLYDGRTGRPLANVPGETCAVLTSPPELVFWSERAKELAAVPFDGRGAFVVPLAEAPARLTAAGGSRLLVSFDERTEVRGADLGVVATIPVTGTVLPSADGAYAVLEHRIADLANGKVVLAVAGFDRGVAWAPHGHALAYGDSSSLHVWTGPGAPAPPPRRVTSPITAIAWSADDRSLAFIDLSNHLFVAPADGGPARPVGASKNPGELAFSPDARKITVGWDTVAVWDVARGELEATLPNRRCEIDWVSTHGPRAVCPAPGAAGTPTVLEVRHLGASNVESATRAAIDGVDVSYAWHEDDRALEATCADGTAAFFGPVPAQLATLERDAAFRKRALAGRRPSEVRFVDAREAIAVVAGGAVEAWDKKSGAKRFSARLPAHIGEVAWSADATLLAAAPDDGSSKVFVLDARTGAIVRALDQARDVRHAYFHPKESMLVTSRGGLPAPSGEGADEVRVWDARSGRLMKKFPGTFGAFSPDGGLVSVVAEDSVRTFDVKTLFSLATVKGRSMFAAFTRDGRGIFTPSTKLTPGRKDATADDAGLDLRDARTGIVLLHAPDRVVGLAESRDGARLVTLPALASTRDEPTPSFFADHWEVRDHKTTRLVRSLHPLTAPELWDAGRVLATRSRGILRLDRITPHRTLWIAARAREPGRCEIAVFDEAGAFDGPADDLLAFRHGDELRTAALETGPALAARRRPGLLSEFLAGR